MIAILISLWVVSFFVSFLMFQAFDRHCGVADSFNEFMNLLLASVPIVNVISVLILGFLIEKGKNA